MSELLSEKVLHAVLARTDRLPTLPDIAGELLRLEARGQATLEEVLALVATDPELAARVLEFADSPLHGPGNDVPSLERAGRTLGLKGLQRTALFFCVARALPHGGASGIDYDLFWRRAIARSVAARSLALLTGSYVEDEALLCGLLAEVGQIVMAEGLEEAYREVLTRGAPWPSVQDETAVLGFDHTDVGAALFSTWNLPEGVLLASRHMAQPGRLPAEASETDRALVCIMALACTTVELLFSEDKGDALTELEERAYEYFRLPTDPVYAFVSALGADITELTRLLELSPPAESGLEEPLEEALRQILHAGIDEDPFEHDEREAVARVPHRSEITCDPQRRDPDTGLTHRDAFDEFLAREIDLRLTRGASRPVGLLVIAIDDAAALRDHDQTAADDQLGRAAAIVKSLVRRGDLIAQLGEDRMAVIMSEGDPAALRVLAERLRSGVAEKTGDTDQGPITLSLGGVCCAAFTHAEDAAGLERAALLQLQRATAAGGDRWEVPISLHLTR